MNPNTFSSKGITMPCRFLFSIILVALFLLSTQVVKASRGSEVLPDSIPISALESFISRALLWIRKSAICMFRTLRSW